MNESFRDVAVQRGRQVPRTSSSFGTGPISSCSSRPIQIGPALGFGASDRVVGMMNSQDGVDLAIEALAELLRRRSDWHTVFVGDGDVLPDAERGCSVWASRLT